MHERVLTGESKHKESELNFDWLFIWNISFYCTPLRMLPDK